MENAEKELPGITLCPDLYQMAEGTDALVLATEWNEFKQLDFERIYKLMRTPVLVDGRNQWDGKQLREMGFTYFGIGQGNHIGAENN
jgi:UDPglucose 6-dehydrogenase